MKHAPEVRGGVLGGVDWKCWSVVLLKPDCVRRGLADAVLDRLAPHAEIRDRRDVTVADWQVFVHYWDLLVDADWFDLDIPGCLRSMYVGHTVTVALAHGPTGLAHRLRALLGHFDPSEAPPGSIRGDLGTDSLTAARAEGRLVENLVHTSDDAEAACRDFGIWYGANHHRLLTEPSLPEPRRTPS
ncbi:nucleoside-diphosphate kinase [Streptomyces sp. SBT349]|uniref:nucleoside-diphosphate kinase n=1 Tax=Streptomyces sp. SBT349 TaxID=1580539 RepID=UPI0007C76632|nr:nucleoside-diphosphate kinase [Streptomyces sp. SBT349]